MANRLSIAMCTYNGERFLAEQLASIAAQTKPPFELIVCDDGSTDGTTTLVEQFAALAPFPVRLFRNERTRGVVGNFEAAIGFCEGDLIALADQDDVWNPEKLEHLGTRFQADSTIGLVFSDALVVAADLTPTGHRLWPRVGFGAPQKQALESGDALNVLLPGWFVTGATMAFRAGLRDLVLPIPRDLQLIHDGWIAVAIAAVARVECIDECLVLYRQHEGQQIGAPAAAESNDGKGVWAALRRVNPYSQQMAITRALQERLHSRPQFQLLPGTEKTLDDRFAHFRARATLPAQPLRRVRVVTGELTAGRYHRFSKGLVSALKDLRGGLPSKGSLWAL